MALAADLAKILRQAEQPIPDFLQSGGTATYQGNKYGGSDVRVSEAIMIDQIVDFDRYFFLKKGLKVCCYPLIQVFLVVSE